MLLSDQLKDRELDIIKLMARGLSNNEIARKLYLARETIRWYNKQIYTKLEVHNRTHAVARAQELGLLDEQAQPSLEMPVPPVQYVKSGDAYIAYQVIGSGAIDILSINGFISHLECAWEQPRYRHTIAQLSRMGRVIMVDKRGFGLSDRVLDSPTLEQTAGDIKAVLDAVGSQSAIVVSGCEGAMAACLSTMLFPQQVHGLVLVNALAKGSRAPGFPWAMPFDTYEYIFENVRQEWGGPFALDYFVPNADSTFRQWWAKFVRLAASPGTALKAVQLMREMDMTELLPQVSAPTLVLHARDNRVVRVGSGRFIASQIPKAQYIEIIDDCHLWWWNSDAYLAEIACFIKRLHGHQDSHCA